MKRRKNHTILAIDPGTRELGFAVFDGEELLYHGVKSIKVTGSPNDRLQKGRMIIERMFKDFDPDVLAIEKTFFANNRNTSLLNVLIDELVTMAKRRGCRVIPLAASTVKKAICGNGRAPKIDVAKVVISQHPELKAYLGNGRKWITQFQTNMFDAVAIGITARRLLDKEKKESRS